MLTFTRFQTTPFYFLETPIHFCIRPLSLESKDIELLDLIPFSYKHKLAGILSSTLKWYSTKEEGTPILKDIEFKESLEGYKLFPSYYLDKLIFNTPKPSLYFSFTQSTSLFRNPSPSSRNIPPTVLVRESDLYQPELISDNIESIIDPNRRITTPKLLDNSIIKKNFYLTFQVEHSKASLTILPKKTIDVKQVNKELNKYDLHFNPKLDNNVLPTIPTNQTIKLKLPLPKVPKEKKYDLSIEAITETHAYLTRFPVIEKGTISEYKNFPKGSYSVYNYIPSSYSISIEFLDLLKRDLTSNNSYFYLISTSRYSKDELKFLNTKHDYVLGINDHTLKELLYNSDITEEIPFIQYSYRDNSKGFIIPKIKLKEFSTKSQTTKKFKTNAIPSENYKLIISKPFSRKRALHHRISAIDDPKIVKKKEWVTKLLGTNPFPEHWETIKNENLEIYNKLLNDFKSKKLLNYDYNPVVTNIKFLNMPIIEWLNNYHAKCCPITNNRYLNAKFNLLDYIDDPNIDSLFDSIVNHNLTVSLIEILETYTYLTSDDRITNKLISAFNRSGKSFHEILTLIPNVQ